MFRHFLTFGLTCLTTVSMFAASALAEDGNVPANLTLEFATLERIGELAGAAAHYGFSNEGVGILLLVGNNLQETGHEITYFANGFETHFSDAGAPARAFYAYIDKPGTLIEYFTQDTHFDDMNFDEAFATIQEAADNFLSNREILSE